MANLLGANIGTNYKGFLNLDSTINTPLDATLRAVTDGMGTVSPLQLATTLIGITSSLNVGGVFSNLARLHIKGSGTTSATTSLLVQNSAGVSSLQVLDNGSVVNYGGGSINTNSAFGSYALLNNTTGAYNTANGLSALQSNTTGGYNTANGVSALESNTTGNLNTANGVNALYSNTTGYNNTANGVNALSNNTTGNLNTANGVNALSNNTTGNLNTANGVNALSNNTTGYNNTANGVSALLSNTTGYQNTGLGYNSQTLNSTDSNSIVIGSNAIGLGSNTAVIGDANIVTTALRGNVGIGTTTPVLTSILDLTSTTKGFLPPRMTTTQKNAIASPASGLQVYDATLNQISYYNGTSWINV